MAVDPMSVVVVVVSVSAKYLWCSVMSRVFGRCWFSVSGV